jgi:membrane associated rhomboid family serine protease
MAQYDFGMPPIPKTTRNLMIALAVIFVLEQLPKIGEWLGAYGMLWPIRDPNFGPWQLLTYAFLHYDISHLFFNLLGLFMFGMELDRLWGWKRYLQLLAASAIMGGLVHLALGFLLPNQTGPLLGVSGAVFGLLMAQAMMFPHRPILFFMVLPMETRTAVMLFGAIELMLGVSHDGVAHFAHLGGMLGGWLMIKWWRSGGGRGRKPPLRRVH